MFFAITGVLLAAAAYLFRCVRSRLAQTRVLKQNQAIKSMFSCRFSITMPCKRKFVTVQGDFCRVTGVLWKKLCF